MYINNAWHNFGAKCAISRFLKQSVIRRL
jgi:hypothetical protein